MAQAATETINGKAGAEPRGVTTVRDASFDLFRSHGLTTMFGNPGSTELPMLHELPSDFTYVLGLQEAVVVGMADGYAQAARTPVHVNLHTAPGLGNAVGAIFNAQANKTPMLVTAGQQVRAHMTMQANLTNRGRHPRGRPVREVGVRAAARRGRAGGAGARDPHGHAAAPRAGAAVAADGRLGRGGGRRLRGAVDRARR